MRSGELAAQADEERLQRERHRELELLGLSPGRSDDGAGPLGPLEALAGRVGISA